MSFACFASVLSVALDVSCTSCWPVSQELSGCALIRELHVYGLLVAAGREAVPAKIHCSHGDCSFVGRAVFLHTRL